MVIGLGKSGIALAEYIHKHGGKVTAYDKNPSEEALSRLNKSIPVKSGEFCEEWLDKTDMLILSPGVPTKLDFILKAKEKGIETIGEIEFAYRHCKGKIIAITGTNGKTTTTTLTGEILKNAGFDTYVVGNIGNVFISEVDNISENSAVVAEISSYQLESVVDFKPMICAILNVTPDHLSRHGSMEAYIDAKKTCFKNMDASSYVVLNADNSVTAEMDVGNRKPIFFSTQKKLGTGAWLEEDMLVINTDGKTENLCLTSELNILGRHNIENALAAALLAKLYGASADAIRNTLKSFMGVEHRIEYCGQVNGIRFYNDSKGTNCDSTIKAIQSMPSKTALILGGFDKGGSFDELFDVIDDKIKAITVIGQTAPLILETAKRYGYENITYCKTFGEAIEKAFEACSSGDNVLLSPACASWDMFDNYEQRGKTFKQKAEELIEKNKYILM